MYEWGKFYPKKVFLDKIYYTEMYMTYSTLIYIDIHASEMT